MVEVKAEHFVAHELHKSGPVALHIDRRYLVTYSIGKGSFVTSLGYLGTVIFLQVVNNTDVVDMVPISALYSRSKLETLDIHAHLYAHIQHVPCFLIKLEIIVIPVHVVFTIGSVNSIRCIPFHYEV